MNAPCPINTVDFELADILHRHRAGLTLGELFTQSQLGDTFSEVAEATTRLERAGMLVTQGDVYRHHLHVPARKTSIDLHQLLDGANPALREHLISRYPEAGYESDGGEA